MSEHSRTRRVAGIPLESATTAAALEALLAPWRVLTDPRFDGFGNLPSDGRYLLVGKHTTLGFFDIPFLVLDIHKRTGIGIRRVASVSTSEFRAGGVCSRASAP
jgi:1-acyl-sn-glycerol-3-phosphate acyltransferase